MKTLFLGFAGLNTPPESAVLGLRPFLEAEASKRGDKEPIFFSCADQNLFAAIDKTIGDFADQCGDDEEFQIVMVGHSFGGAAIKALTDQLKYRVQLAVLLDPAPNEDRFHQHYPWQVADLIASARWSLNSSIVSKALVFYQHNMQIAGVGVCGVPIQELEGRFRNIDVSSWGLTHNDMVSDPRVQKTISYAFDQLVPL